MNERNRLIGIPILALVIAGCGAVVPSGSPVAPLAVDPTPPTSGVTPLATASSAPASTVGPTSTRPPGGLARFDTATLSADSKTLTLAFVGGQSFSATNPCSSAYTAWAEAVGDVLYAAVVDVTPPLPSLAPNVACDAVGYARTASVDLPAPFGGARVIDLAGNVHFIRPPDELAVLTGLPDGWQLRSQRDVEDSPTGRWLRVYAPTADPPLDISKGHLDLYQAFAGAANVAGGDEHRDVTVNGQPALLYRNPLDGELVLVWLLGGNGFALVANEADFPADALIRLAESARLP
jgi:hypothetical protein